jgi:hypothetical protein
MSFIPGNSGSTAKATDGIEGATAGSPLVLPSGFSGSSQRPFAASDANLVMDVATHGGLVSMTPTATRTVTLPSVNVYTGYAVSVINLSVTQSININASAGGSVTVVGPNSTVTVYSTAATPTLPAQWSINNAGSVAVGGNSIGTALTLGTNDNFALNFKTNGAVNATASTTGAWIFGPSASSNISHVFRGRATDGTTFFNTAFQSEGTEYQIKLERTSTNAGFAYIGADGVSALKVRNQSGVDVAAATQAGAWTFGPASDSSQLHAFNGVALRIRNGGGSGGYVEGSQAGTPQWFLGKHAYNNFTNSNIGFGSVVAGVGIEFCSGNAVAGGVTATGSWTFGPTTGNAIHRFRAGGFASVYIDSTSSSADLYFTRNGTGTGGAGISVNGNGTAGSMFFYNGTNSNPAATFVGGYAADGGWIFGPTAGGVAHRAYGRIWAGPGSDIGSGILQASDAGNNVNLLSLHRPASTVIHHYINGSSYNIQNNTNGVSLAVNGTSWAAISDVRQKKNIVPLDHGLSKVMEIETIRFDYLAEENGSSRIGFSAQNLLNIIPECVHGDDTYNVTPTDLIPVLVKAIQELKAEVDTLKGAK